MNKIHKRKFIRFLIIISTVFIIFSAVTYQYNYNKIQNNFKKEYNNKLHALNENINKYKLQLIELETKEKHLEDISKAYKITEDFKKKYDNAIEFKITSYDLSYKSCEKTKTDRGYGITFNGTDLRGHTVRTAKTVACDPKVIPLGSVVYISFIDEKYKKLDGVYIANDIGGGVKGKHLDLFLGDFNSYKENDIVKNFGCVKAKVILLK